MEWRKHKRLQRTGRSCSSWTSIYIYKDKFSLSWWSHISIHVTKSNNLELTRVRLFTSNFSISLMDSLGGLYKDYLSSQKLVVWVTNTYDEHTTHVFIFYALTEMRFQGCHLNGGFWCLPSVCRRRRRGSTGRRKERGSTGDYTRRWFHRRKDHGEDTIAFLFAVKERCGEINLGLGGVSEISPLDPFFPGLNLNQPIFINFFSKYN